MPQNKRFKSKTSKNGFGRFYSFWRLREGFNPRKNLRKEYIIYIRWGTARMKEYGYNKL